MIIIVRQVTIDDWQKLKRIRLQSLAESPEAFALTYATAAQFTDNDWKLRATVSSFPTFFIALADENPVGIIGGVIVDQEYTLISMWVTPTSRGQDVARKLVDALRQHAMALGYGKMVLMVSPENKRASHFYLKQGFIFLDETDRLESNPEIILQKMAMKISA
jgi:ribosomal protein S18 acetylase RimI-like enzyme